MQILACTPRLLTITALGQGDCVIPTGDICSMFGQLKHSPGPLAMNLQKEFESFHKEPNRCDVSLDQLSNRIDYIIG